MKNIYFRKTVSNASQFKCRYVLANTSPDHGRTQWPEIRRGKFLVHGHYGTDDIKDAVLRQREGDLLFDRSTGQLVGKNRFKLLQKKFKAASQ